MGSARKLMHIKYWKPCVAMPVFIVHDQKLPFFIGIGHVVNTAYSQTGYVTMWNFLLEIGLLHEAMKVSIKDIVVPYLQVPVLED